MLNYFTKFCNGMTFSTPIMTETIYTHMCNKNQITFPDVATNFLFKRIKTRSYFAMKFAKKSGFTKM